MTRTEKLLHELIALPSVNPALMPQGDSRAGEQRVAEFLATVASRVGLDIEFRAVFPKRANLLARLTPAGQPRQRVLLAPHLDTVGDAAMPDTLFRPTKRNGRLYGRGACDTKGSAAAMFVALSDLAESPQRPRHTEIVFAGVAEGGMGHQRSRGLVMEGYRAELAMIGEPTRLRVVTAHKGDVWLELETRGKAAHGALPELGKNAVHQMARIVDLLQTQYARRLRDRRHRLLGHATVSVGTIRGGTQPNIVPVRCTITIDRRTLPGETQASVASEVRSLLRRHRFTAAISSYKSAPCLALETDLKHPLVAQFLRTVKQSKPAVVHFYSDAGALAQGGIPSVLFGPGDIAHAHTPDEWVSLAQLERAKNLLRRFLESLP